jgi:hypothetical protein
VSFDLRNYSGLSILSVEGLLDCGLEISTFGQDRMSAKEVFVASRRQRKVEWAKVAGKWTRREELYAGQLIKNFINGTLTDCQEGCTLRAYLARKLECAPMRISKKFSGQNLGKVSTWNMLWYLLMTGIFL